MLLGLAIFRPPAPYPVLSSDGAFQVTVPGSWTKRSDLHDEAELQVANPQQECYVVVLSEPKSDFQSDLTYHKHSDLTRQMIMESLKNGKETAGPKEIEINGLKAVQYEIRGVVDNLEVVYLHTTIDGKTRFHQVLAWTLPSKLTANRPVLESVINSFREK